MEKRVRLYSIKKLGNAGFVEVTYFPGTNKEVVRSYNFQGKREGSGFVYDVTEDTGTYGYQVCNRMQRRGDTLRVDGGGAEEFFALIKRELRKWAYDVRKRYEEKSEHWAGCNVSFSLTEWIEEYYF